MRRLTKTDFLIALLFVLLLVLIGRAAGGAEAVGAPPTGPWAGISAAT